MKTQKILIGYIIGENNSGVDRYIETIVKELRNEYGDLTIGLLTSNNMNAHLKQLEEMYGLTIHRVPNLKHPFKQYKAIKKLLKEVGYDSIYMNISECSNFVGIYAGYRLKLKKIITHSHSSNISITGMKSRLIKVVHFMVKPFLSSWNTHYFACSKEAANWLYTDRILKDNRVTYVFNYIQTKRFEYSNQKRLQLRKELGLEDNFVVGLIANFYKVKNHFFAVQIIKDMIKKNDKARLLLVGDGPERDSVEQEVKRLGLQDYVIFLGIRNDVHELLSACDCMILPSFFEGLNISAIEGQVSGLDCFLSSNVSRETMIGDTCHFIELDKGSDYWSDYIMNNVTARKDYDFSKFSKYDASMYKEIATKIVE